MELLKAGCRMSKPPGCPSDVYSVMSRCWSYQPELRPQWSSLVAELHVQYLQTRPGEYLELTPPTLDTPPSSPESSTAGFGQAHQSSPGYGLARHQSSPAYGLAPQSSPGYGLAHHQSSPGYGLAPQSSPQVHSPYAFQPSANLSLDNENYVFNDFRFQGIIPSYTATTGDSVEPTDTYITVPISRNHLPSGIDCSPSHRNQPPSGVPPSPNRRNNPQSRVFPSLTRNNPQSGMLPSPTRHIQPPSRVPPSLSQHHHPSIVPPPSSHQSSMAVTFPPRHRPSHGVNPVSRHDSTSISTPPSPRHQGPSIFFPTSPRYSPIFPVTPSPSAPMLSPVTPPTLDPAPTRARGRGPVISPETQVLAREVDEAAMLTGGRGFNPRDVGLDSPPDSIPDSSHRLSNAGSASSVEGDEHSRRGYGESVMRCDGGYRDCGYANCLSQHGGSRVVLAVDTDPMWVGFNKYVDTGQREADTEYGYGGIRRGGSRQRGSSESGYGTTLESNSALSGRLPSESDSVFENEPEFSRRRPSLSNKYVKTGAEALQPLLKRT